MSREKRIIVKVEVNVFYGFPCPLGNSIHNGKWRFHLFFLLHVLKNREIKNLELVGKWKQMTWLPAGGCLHFVWFTFYWAFWIIKNIFWSSCAHSLQLTQNVWWTRIKMRNEYQPREISVVLGGSRKGADKRGKKIMLVMHYAKKRANVAVVCPIFNFHDDFIFAGEHKILSG